MRIALSDAVIKTKKTVIAITTFTKDPRQVLVEIRPYIPEFLQHSISGAGERVPPPFDVLVVEPKQLVIRKLRALSRRETVLEVVSHLAALFPQAQFSIERVKNPKRKLAEYEAVVRTRAETNAKRACIFTRSDGVREDPMGWPM